MQWFHSYQLWCIALLPMATVLMWSQLIPVVIAAVASKPVYDQCRGCWLLSNLCHLPPTGRNNMYKEAFSSGDHEPWVFQGGLQAEFQVRSSDDQWTRQHAIFTDNEMYTAGRHSYHASDDTILTITNYFATEIILLLQLFISIFYSALFAGVVEDVSEAVFG